MKKIGAFFKHYIFYIAGFLLLGWGITSTVIAIRNGLEVQRQSGDDNAVVVATGFVPYALELTTPTPDPLASPTATLLPNVTPPPTPTPMPVGEKPSRIVVAEIGLDSPVINALVQVVEIDGKTYQQWTAPDEKAVGWQNSSAGLGVPGNTVLNGHHNVHGKVFEKLIYLVPGDIIEVYGETKVFRYTVINKLLLEERDMPVEKRIENAQWIMPSSDERLTLITCWPETSNTHRLILVAVPESSHLVPSATPTITLTPTQTLTSTYTLTPTHTPTFTQTPTETPTSTPVQ